MRPIEERRTQKRRDEGRNMPFIVNGRENGWPGGKLRLETGELASSARGSAGQTLRRRSNSRIQGPQGAKFTQKRKNMSEEHSDINVYPLDKLAWLAYL
jgi:hypothetical protein